MAASGKRTLRMIDSLIVAPKNRGVAGAWMRGLAGK
jgi:hypothetical protein